MSDWNKLEDRKLAAWRFLTRLEQDSELRDECLKYPWKARQVFEEVGGFTNMPASVEFRAIENERASLDNFHVIAVPPKGTSVGPIEKFDPNIYWLAAWSRWE